MRVLLILAACAAVALSGAQFPPRPSSPGFGSAAAPTDDPGVLRDCVVTLIADVNVPADLQAQEGGVLTGLRTDTPGPDGQPLKVTEGVQVKLGQVLAQIDLRTAQAIEQAAQYRLQAAEREAKNDVNVRYAKAAALVAHADFESAEIANRDVPGTIPAIEVRRLRLLWEQYMLQIEQALHEQELADKNLSVRQAELEVAQLDLQRRQIKAPTDGVVVEVYVDEGEWVRAGDPILRVVRIDKLRVEGFLDANKLLPAQVDGKPVTVEMGMPGGLKRTFEGKVVYASYLVETGARFRIRAEVDNQQVDGAWQLRPGQTVTMTIHWR
jgi:macrolide-specific efflux system membrane fusion protein